MADEQYRWLDRDTAERLLRGEPLDNVDPTVRDQAERLAQTLKALSAEPFAAPFDKFSAGSSPAGAELPGEAAALAAFRKARAEQAGGRASPGRPDTGDAAEATADPAGLVRIGAHAAPGTGRSPRSRSPRRGRRVRLALSLALAAGAVGGAAAAATTGVLPTPFGGDEPGPAASVSAQATPDRPLVSPSPDGTVSHGAGTVTSGGATGGPSDGSGRNTAGGGSTPGHDSTAGTDDEQDGHGSRWSRLAAACRDLRDGKDLDYGRKHVLEGAAGGATRVWTYCKDVLKTVDGRSGDAGGSGKGGNRGGDGSGRGGQNGHGHKGGGQGGDDEGGHIGAGIPGQDATTPPPFGPLRQGRTATSVPTAPHPTYSAL
ncbi:extensin [Streptomyces sp. NPDC020801]|uniref:extensin n=1 Tax=unclassified Streptomyces TaxID=2593676 RepID=UPI0037BCFE09